MDIIKQLLDIYYNEEFWHRNKMPYQTAYSYHKTMFDKGNIIVNVQDEKVLGYVEFWLINEEQLSHILDDGKFCGDTEDTENGDICYVANMWIDPQYRNNGIIKQFKREIFTKYKGKIYTGEEVKNNNRLRIHWRN
jgi:ribosomal protein S18 acetylase RimI-like enzyme